MSINWAIIGCGDVAEVKSGPAFKKAPNSDLLAVMRRDLAKAEDFAKRHGVARFYDDAAPILEDPAIDAVYIATPPSSHLEYALKVLAADKHLYLEKPMALSVDECRQIAAAAEKSQGKLVVAHYRRGWPMFQKVKQLLLEGFLGEVRMAQININQVLNLFRKYRLPCPIAHINNKLSSIIQNDTVDFGHLPEAMQLTVIETLIKHPKLRNQITPEKLNIPFPKDTLDKNHQLFATHHSPETRTEQLTLIYQQLSLSAPEKPSSLDTEKLLITFLDSLEFLLKPR